LIIEYDVRKAIEYIQAQNLLADPTNLSYANPLLQMPQDKQSLLRLPSCQVKSENIHYAKPTSSSQRWAASNQQKEQTI
jgi:hypothetical protein